MKNKLLTLCMLFSFFVCGVKGQDYKLLTSETIVYTTSVGNISDKAWMGGKAGTTSTSDFKSNQKYEAKDDVILSATSDMLTVKPATNTRFISFYVTGVSKVYAYGVAGNSAGRGISIESACSDNSIITPKMTSFVGSSAYESGVVEYPADEDLDPAKSYIISVRGVGGDSYLYAVRFVVPSGPSTDNTLHSLTVNNESITTISDAMEVSIPYTYNEPTVPVAFEVDAAASVAINGSAVTNPSTVAAPEANSGASVNHTITVTAEDRISKDYTLTITRATVSSVPTLEQVTVGGEAITFDEGSNSFAYPALPYGTTNFPEVAATASNGSSIASITQATIDSPIATIHVLAEDGTTVAVYTVSFSIADPNQAKIVTEGIVKEWDLSVWSDETLAALSAEGSGWTVDNNKTRYQNSAAYDAGNLKAGSAVLTDLAGLSFPKETSASKTSIRFAGSLLGLQLGGAREVTLDEALTKGQTVRVIVSSPNTTSLRGIASTTNLSGACGVSTYGMSHVEYNFTVSADGIVKFKSSEGIILEKIQVLDLTSQTLTSGALSSLTDVKLAGDITTTDIAILNAADLTSIDLTETSTVAAGLNPKNQNCLVYANEALAGVKNVVVGDAAETIELTDGVDFNNTKPFTAATIKYTRYLYKGWNTIAFPFPYTVNGDRIESYSSADASTVVFVEASGQLNANQAYLINAEADGDKEFTAIGAEVPVTAAVGEVFKSNFRSFAMSNDANLYKLNNDGTAFNHSDGTALVGAFRGYLDLSSVQSASAPALSRRIIHGDGSATRMESISAGEMSVYSGNGALIIHTDHAQIVRIHSIDGCLVRTVVLEAGENIVNGLSKGIYLVGKQKVAL